MAMAAIILAAGASSRMRGADKLMQEVDGQPLLARTIALAQASCAPVLVCLPTDKADREAVVTRSSAEAIVVENHAKGMGVSLATGVRALREDVEEVMVFVGDLPELTAADVRSVQAVARQFPRTLIVRAGDDDGRPGHPVVFRRPLFAALAALEGDHGARDVIHAHRDRMKLVALARGHATTDLDTPEDWAAWRAHRP